MEDLEKQDCLSMLKELDELANTLENIVFIVQPHGSDETKDSDGLSEKRHRFGKIFMLLYHKSLKDNFLWQFCPYEVYDSYFEHRKSVFLHDYQYGTINDFCIREIRNFDKGDNQNLLQLTPLMEYKFFLSKREHQLNLCSYLNKKDYDNIYFSQRKKLEFLKKLMNNEQAPSNQEFFLDYSDSSEAEKIVFLYDLGILDFLRKHEPFSTSTNKLAEVISGFTGINHSTAQSYLNPIFSKEADQSKSARKPKTIKSVAEKLIKMGYFSKNSNPLQST